ncbi:MAG: holin [Angustibacter sp.]
MSYFSRAFLAAAGERALKTFAQTLAALLAAGGAGVLDVDWLGGLSVAASAAVVSLLSSVASGGVGAPGPSLTSEGLSADRANRAKRNRSRQVAVRT